MRSDVKMKAVMPSRRNRFSSAIRLLCILVFLLATALAYPAQRSTPTPVESDDDVIRMAVSVC